MHTDRVRRPLINRRVLICGKGGSGKSTLTALLGNELAERGYLVVLLDGDASNPGGLSRLVMGAAKGPQPLIKYFGGREKVTCPVDDPSPLLIPCSDAVEGNIPMRIDMLPPEYYIRDGNKILMQSGKIAHLLEGCDGPMSKITRDLRFSDDHIMLIDVEAGIEHFGRGVETHVDMVLVVVDPAFESLEVAGRVSDFCADIGIYHVWLVLNAVKNVRAKDMLEQKLREKDLSVLGVLHYKECLETKGLEGKRITRADAPEVIPAMVDKLERTVCAETGS